MWVPAEETKVAINSTGFDPRHLPGLRLPRNLRATTDPVEAAKDADFLIFNVFSEEMERIMRELKGKVKDTCRAVVMSKILMPSEQLKLGSAYVTEALGRISFVLFKSCFVSLCIT